MAKQPPVNPITPDIIQMPLEDVMHMSMMPYAEHVILERALPRVEDGLKPVQRRILYTMMELGNTPDKPHRKCARIVGDCLGKYHPHGDSSVYDALVRMAQGFSLRATLVDGHGNFGSIDGDSAAAMRYTEARMAPLALQMLRDLDKDTVPFHLNFDDTLKEPEILPARFPNLLVNGASGIAVGLATNIPPHNLSEVIRAVDLRIDKPKATLDDFMQVLPAPDFPTGGVLLDTPEIRAAYQTGRGKLTEQSVKEELVIWAIAEAENFTISDERRASELASLLSYYNYDDLASMCEAYGFTEEYMNRTMTYSIYYVDALDMLVENATFTGAK